MQSQIRTVAEIEYTLTRKTVKNLNLRVRTDGSVAVSAPKRMSVRQIDRFVLSRKEWIQKAQQEMAQRQKIRQQTTLPSVEQCMAVFEPISQAIYPLFAQTLQNNMPQLKVKDMKTRWGVCHISKRTITLAQQLATKPLPAIEYVILHEYCHFVHANHQKEFWALVEQYMPDWKIRRAMLKEP